MAKFNRWVHKGEHVELAPQGTFINIPKSISREKNCGVRFFPYSIFIAGILLIGGLTGAESQLMGKKAEMDRLEVKAEEAMADGDLHGAALVIGRAALMASELAKKEDHTQTKLFYEGAEDLFRTQENAYRALALFEQAGGQIPAPVGVCQLLSLADTHGRSATRKLGQAATGSEAQHGDLYGRLTKKNQEWIQVVDELQADFSCT